MKAQSGRVSRAVAVPAQKFNSSNAVCYARLGNLESIVTVCERCLYQLCNKLCLLISFKVQPGICRWAVAVPAQKFNSSNAVCYARVGRLVSANVRHLRSWGNRTTSAGHR